MSERKPPESDERVRIPLDPEDALRALLKVDPESEPVTEHQQPTTMRPRKDLYPGYPESEALRVRLGLTETDLDAFVGLGLDEANAKAKQRGLSIRVMRRDDQPLIGTMDLRLGRINVATRAGRVERMLGLG